MIQHLRRGALVLALACWSCQPSWPPPAGEEVEVGSGMIPPAAFCASLAPFGDQAALARAVKLPHHLEDVAGAAPTHPDNLHTAVRDVFQTHGYYQRAEASAEGMVGIGKRLSKSTNIALSFDVGTWSVSSSALAFVTVDGRYTSIRLPPSSAAAERNQYPIRSAAEWRLLLENYHASAAFIESRVAGCASERRHTATVRALPPNVAADATRVSSPTSSRLASTSSGSAQQLGRVAPLNS